MDSIVIAVAFLSLSSVYCNNITCTRELQNLLGNLSSVYHYEDNSLALKLPFEELNLTNLCGTKNFSVELWRAINHSSEKVPQDFGTRDYFSKFQNCDSPNPDLLWKHGDSILASVDADRDSKADFVFKENIRFYHVVEKQYMLRICPCINPKVPCTCEHAVYSVAVCSEIMNISNSVEEQVFPWCKGDIQSAPAPLIGVPVLQHCPAKVMLTGTLPSCTPVRKYDQVEVVLQPMAQEVVDCKELPREGVGRIRELISLEAVNITHGMFHVVIANITHDTQYCLRIELVNHPYCISGSDHTLTRLSPVCRPISLKKPIMIEDHVCGTTICDPGYNLPLITGASLAAAILLAVGLVISHRIACSNRANAGETGGASHLLLPPSTPFHPDIFFLYWNESKDFIEVNRLVVRWLTGIGHRVIDLSDELLQEELMSNPESWITENLEDGKVKVIVVESETVNECLKTECEAELSSGVDHLKVLSLKHIQARLSRNYQRLSVVQYKVGLSGPVSSLVPHTRYTLPAHLAELQAWLVETHGWDDNGNLESGREQTLRDLKAAVQRYTGEL